MSGAARISEPIGSGTDNVLGTAPKWFVSTVCEVGKVQLVRTELPGGAPDEERTEESGDEHGRMPQHARPPIGAH